MTDFRCYICSEGEDQPVPATHPGCEHLGQHDHIDGVTWGLCDECHAAGGCPECAEEKRCQCGEWSGERCEGELGDDAVTVEFMPEYLRQSCIAAGNRGRYPHNGSVRIRVTPECAALMAETDGEWCEEQA